MIERRAAHFKVLHKNVSAHDLYIYTIDVRLT
ncbi:hypothetical protein Fuma_02409 [Fuerstiella marisgermanici]|uniref:Uncharacterized protein n=1 Tax=Fuerstiella marisgermanici TaxID=1891926 RepID=A0A1P8WFJ0_9PLAN|nr:hypothetical protein Fuma_02409 [Fuerstiella marisgermanici]